MGGIPNRNRAKGRHWVPNVNRVETKNAYLIIIELPHVCKDSISVAREDSLLRIQGEHCPSEPLQRKPQQEGNLSNDRFDLSFTLTDNSDRSNIEASYKNGLLTLRIPKITKSKPEGYYVDVT